MGLWLSINAVMTRFRFLPDKRTDECWGMGVHGRANVGWRLERSQLRVEGGGGYLRCTACTLRTRHHCSSRDAPGRRCTSPPAARTPGTHRWT